MAILINAGAAAANGVALLADNPNRKNGMFGAVLGGITMGTSAAGYIATYGDSQSEQYFLVLGACGLASFATGYLNIKSAADGESDGLTTGEVRLFPAYFENGRNGHDLGIGIRFDFDLRI